jgi:dTDP-4-dehydrorhamnose reductase
MRILVTGKNGQLGRTFQKLVSDKKNNDYTDFQCVFAGRDELDFSLKDSIISYFKNNYFDVLINCAAYTKVDEAEDNEEKANLINNSALLEIAKIANKNNMRIIHISSDYVFDGAKNKPYSEKNIASPLNIYGKTKLAGEKAILSLMNLNAVIIRSGWIYSDYGNNFVDTILKLAKENTYLKIVSDQIGSPTYANDLAETILKIIDDKNFNQNDFSSKIFNYSNLGGCSWYDFAKEIVSVSKINCKITPIKTQDYPLPAIRPKYSILSKKKIIKEFEIDIKHWKESLKVCLENLSNS